MNKRTLTQFIPASVLVGIAVLTIGTPAVASEFADGPDDQETSVGGSVVFTLEPRVGGLTFQWVRQWPDHYAELAGETNSMLALVNVDISEVGLYLCRVTYGNQTEYTGAAALFLSTGSTSSGESMSWSLSAQSLSSLSLSGSESFSTMSSGDGDPLTLWGPPVTSSGTQGTCPGSYAGYVNYRKTVLQGWGWAPTAGTTNHIATDNNRTDTKVEYLGKFGDRGCNQTTVSVPDPTGSPAYRFTIYFPSNVPATNAYPITLTGFDP